MIRTRIDRILPGIAMLAMAWANCAAAAAEPAPLDQTLDRLVAAYGGADNLARLDNMVQEWDFVALMGNRQGTDVRSVQSAGRLRVELTYPDKKEVRILDQEKAWVMFDDRPAEAARAAQRDAMRLQLMRLYSPLALRERRDRLQLHAEGDWLALTLVEDGLQADYLVNPETWRIETVVGTLNVNGAAMRFRTEYSDFTFVEGVLVHQRENKFAGSVNTAQLRLKNVKLGAELSRTLFVPSAIKGET